MKFVLAFDSDCGPCTRFKEAICFLDTRRKMEYVGLERADVKGLLEGVPVGLRRRSFHLISPGGDVKSGPAALPGLARLLPMGRLPAAFMERCPPVSRAAEGLYLVLSRLHYAGGCSRYLQGEASRSISMSMRRPSGRREPSSARSNSAPPVL